MAQAAVMGSLSAALTIVSVVVPFAGGLSLLVAVPMGLLAYRYRLRVLLAAAFAASTVAFLIAGISGFMVVLNCAYVGGATGIIKRRGRGTPTVIAGNTVLTPVLDTPSMVSVLARFSGNDADVPTTAVMPDPTADALTEAMVVPPSDQSC